jgi:hypothetical protein
LALWPIGKLIIPAQDIQDPAFVDSDFFDPRDLPQVRADRGPIRRQSVHAVRLSRPTFYKVQSDFDRSGLVELLPAKRRPDRPHKISSEVARFIEEAAASGLWLPQQIPNCCRYRAGAGVLNILKSVECCIGQAWRGSGNPTKQDHAIFIGD